jgi:hypothetical protein
MNRILRGVIHGNAIELNESPMIADGQQVQVIVKILKPSQPWGEGLKRSAGALAHENPEEDDKILDEIYQDRKRKSHRGIPE